MMWRVSLVSVLLVLLLSSCGKVKDPEFKRVEGFKIKKAGFDKTDIAFNVTYFNPNGFGVTVKEAVADVYVDSVYVGKFTQDNPIDVPRKAEFSIPLTGSIPLMTLLQLNAHDFTNREVLVKAGGSVKVGKAGVFVTRPFDYQGKHQVNVHL